MSDGPSLSKGGVAIPGYEVERELGRGGFAVVYRAGQPKLRRTVALKVLTNVDPSDDDAKRRFEAECQAIGSLSWHPHVVTVYDAGQTEEGLPFLAMENLPSGSLQAKLADHGPAPWEEVLRVAVQMCDALGAAHQAGILHRDIKPANVLTSRIGDYKLADFGIARFGDSQRTATGVITGTVAYTAPEVLRGARASTASDIYALGAMLAAVASGQTPFVKDADESVVAIMYRVNTDDPPSLIEHDIPAELDLLVRTLMDKDPEKRPASALEVAQWAQWIQEQHGITSAPLHTDPDMEPGLPAAAIAAGAGAVAGAAGAAAGSASDAAVAHPQSTDAQAWGQGTPLPPSTPYPHTGAYAPASHPQTGAYAPQTGYVDQSGYAPQTGAYAAPSGTYDAAAGYTPPPGSYTPPPGSYGGGYEQGDPDGSSTGKIIAIAAVIAVIVVILIVAIFALASGGEDNAATTTTDDRRATEPDRTDETVATESTTTESTTTSSTTTEPTTTVAPSTEAPPATYSPAARAAFVSACQDGGASAAVCTCIVDGLEQIYTEDELASLDGDDLPADAIQIATECGTTGG